ncbi:unnamed protein product [Urochloa humidicola]
MGALVCRLPSPLGATISTPNLRLLLFREAASKDFPTWRSSTTAGRSFIGAKCPVMNEMRLGC